MALKALRFAALCELAKTGTIFGGLETVAQKVKWLAQDHMTNKGEQKVVFNS